VPVALEQVRPDDEAMSRPLAWVIVLILAGICPTPRR
jgi:hypothetical protein